MSIDLDQSGRGFHKTRSYLGPSLGWVETQILPERDITAGGTFQIDPGDSVILMKANAATTLLLPDVREWVKQTGTQPATGFTRGLWIKDFVGKAGTNHVTIIPFDTQTIDNLNNSTILSQNYQTLAFYPLIDLSGWYIVVQSFDTGTGGTTAINPTAPINGSVAGNVMNVGLNVDPVIFQTNASNQLALKPIPIASVLGNATLGTGPVIPTSMNAMVDGMIITPQQGQILYRSATGWFGLNPGSPGQVLTTGGPANNPSWTPAGSGTISASGTPANGQYAVWTDATHIKGVDPQDTGFVSALGPITSQYIAYWSDATGDFISAALVGAGLTLASGILAVNFTQVQPFDDDLASLAAASATNSMYYRSAPSTWAPVTIGTNLSFTAGTLSVVTTGLPYLPITGGTLTGALNIDANSPQLDLTATAGQTTQIFGINKTANQPRWSIQLTDGSPETGGNAGNNFSISRYNDASGALIDNPLVFSRATGLGTVIGPPTIPLGIATKGYVDGLITGLSAVYQPLDADLTSLANAASINVMYYRSAVSTWSPVAIGSGITFAGGTLSATGGGGGGDAFLGSTQTFTGVNTFSGTSTLFTGTQAVVGNTAIVSGDTSRLSVHGVSGNPPFAINEWSPDALGAGVNINKSRGAAVGTHTIAQSGDTVGVFRFQASDGTAFRLGAIIEADVTGAPGATAAPMQLVFATSLNNSTSPTTRMVIRNDGNVIVGNTTANQGAGGLIQAHGIIAQYQWSSDTGPTYHRFIKSRSATIGTLTDVADGDSVGYIEFYGAFGGAVRLGAAIQSFVRGTPTGSIVPIAYGFQTTSPAGTFARRLTIDSSGSIVIGPMPFALSNGLFEINNEAAMNVAGVYWNKWSNDATGQELTLQKSRGTSSNIFTTVQGGDILSQIVTLGAYGSGMATGSILRTTVSGAIAAAGITTTFSLFVGDSVGGAINTFNSSVAAGTQIKGTPAADNATAGWVGEYATPVTFTGQVVAGSTTANVATLSLTAGDWDVWINGGVTAGGAGTATLGINTTSATLGGTGTYVQMSFPGPGTATGPLSLSYRISLSSTSNVFAVGNSAGASSMTFFGGMFARRRR